MNTCGDCKYFRSDQWTVDFCEATGEPTFPGNFICGEYEEPEREAPEQDEIDDRRYHEAVDEDRLDRFGNRKIDIDDLIYDREE
jgi:hypothetical protein